MSTSSRPRMDAPDVELLRAFEPVVRFTKGESFLPMSVATYVRSATRIRSHPGGEDVTVAVPGMLTDRTLSDDAPSAPRGAEYLTVAGARDDNDVATLFRSDARQALGFRQRGSRLARVGYTARLVDAAFSLSLLARGRVPGSLARRAVESYREMVGDGRTHPYYGRVVRTATWTALQYWFFYAFNDWRSGFNGANDHEADWEQILVYLDADADRVAVPRWAAYAQHDYYGRDLRRRWDDDRELERVDDHPVVYAGAGSHASYFRAGEYLTEQELRLPPVVRNMANGFSRLMSGRRNEGAERILPIAFVDYARGDGVAIGPGCERTWEPVVLDDGQGWVMDYSGLWGITVQDPFQGENAPAGPMYNRDGTVRLSWADPVAFAELDLEAPRSSEPILLRQRSSTVEERQAALAEMIPERERQLAAVGAEIGQPAGGDSGPTTWQAEGNRLQAELIALHHEREENERRLRELRRRLAAAESGWEPDPQAHLRRIAIPRQPGADRAGLLLEAWAAVSIGLLLLALVAALVLAPRFGVIAAVAVIGLFVFVESILRNRVVDLIAGWVRFLAILATVILAVQFWQAGIIAAAVAAGLFVIRENVAELFAAARTGN